MCFVERSPLHPPGSEAELQSHISFFKKCSQLYSFMNIKLFSLQFVIHEAPGQELEMELYDEDRDKDDFMGR